MVARAAYDVEVGAVVVVHDAAQLLLLRRGEVVLVAHLLALLGRHPAVLERRQLLALLLCQLRQIGLRRLLFVAVQRLTHHVVLRTTTPSTHWPSQTRHWPSQTKLSHQLPLASAVPRFGLSRSPFFFFFGHQLHNAEARS